MTSAGDSRPRHALARRASVTGAVSLNWGPAPPSPGLGALDAVTPPEEADAPLPRSAQSVRRVVVAEDHPDQAAWLIASIKRLRPKWEVRAVVSHVGALLAAFDEHVPEVLFLDVHLADGNIMDALNTLPYPVPIVVTSGDPAFALDAYEHAAVDYLLKPVRPSRLARALARVDNADAVAAPSKGHPTHGWITARKGDSTVIVQLCDVLYLQSQAKYTRLVMRDGEALLRRGLGLVERQLDPRRFHRVHRGTVINIDHAATLVRDDLGRMKLQMRGRTEWLYVSKPFEGLFRSQ